MNEILKKKTDEDKTDRSEVKWKMVKDGLLRQREQRNEIRNNKDEENEWNIENKQATNKRERREVK